MGGGTEAKEAKLKPKFVSEPEFKKYYFFSIWMLSSRNFPGSCILLDKENPWVICTWKFLRRRLSKSCYSGDHDGDMEKISL